MGALARKILDAIEDERYVIGRHANERLRSRRIPAWQVISGAAEGTMLAERPNARPNPVVEIKQFLANGTRVKTVWAWLAAPRVAKLVTVHFFGLEP